MDSHITFPAVAIVVVEYDNHLSFIHVFTKKYQVCPCLVMELSVCILFYTQLHFTYDITTCIKYQSCGTYPTQEKSMHQAFDDVNSITGMSVSSPT